MFLAFAGLLLAFFVSLGGVWAEGLRPDVAWLAPVTYGLAVVTALVALVAVALFKDRARQRKLIAAAQWMDLVLVALVLVGIALVPGAVEGAHVGGTGRYLVALAPVVAYGLLRMARRGVDRDIATVRSMDRLR